MIINYERKTFIVQATGSLVNRGISYGRKEFYSTGPWRILVNLEVILTDRNMNGGIKEQQGTKKLF